MARAVVVVVLCLLAVTGIVGFVGATAEEPTAATTTNADQQPPDRIELGDPTHTDRTTARVYAGAVTDAGTTATEVRLREIRLTNELEDATTSHERGNILDPAIDELEADIQELRASDQAAFEAYANGELTAEGLIEQLVKTTRAAEEYERLLQLIEQEVETVNDLEITDELEAARADLAVFQSETRLHLLEVASAEQQPQTVQITATGTGHGYQIGVINEDTYWLDTYYADQRDRAGNDTSLSFDAVQQRYGELYPTLSDEIFSVVERTEDGVYEVRSEKGFVTEHRILLDARTELPFFEHHSWEVETTPQEELINVTEDGLNFEVTGTVPGGPATVTVTDTGEVIDATVTLDNRTITEAGSHTFVAPRTSTTIEVTTADRRINVTTNWDPR